MKEKEKTRANNGSNYALSLASQEVLKQDRKYLK